MIILHGRGGSARELLALAGELSCAHCLWLAPQAAGSSWYPYSFLAPIEKNEPWLSSAMRKMDEVIQELEQAEFGPERIGLLGFSQGACLALEYASRHPRRYGAVIGLSGGLIGPPGLQRETPAGFVGAPIFLGCSDSDPHIPQERVDETARVLRAQGAAVTERIYPSLGHTINQDEIEFTRAMLTTMTEPG